MATVRLPKQLMSYVNDQQTLSVVGADIYTAILALVQQYPRLKPYLLNTDNNLSQFINYYVNGKDIRFLKEHQPLQDNDIVEVVLATSGG